MYFLYSLGGVTFNKCWITLSILNCYSPNFQGFILMKNALNNQVGMLGDMFLWLVANLKQGVIYFIKQGGGNHKIAWVYSRVPNKRTGRLLENEKNSHLYAFHQTYTFINFQQKVPPICLFPPILLLILYFQSPIL